MTIGGWFKGSGHAEKSPEETVGTQVQTFTPLPGLSVEARTGVVLVAPLPTLTRQALVVPKVEFQEASRKLAQDALKLLGYAPLENKFKLSDLEIKVAQVLEKLGIEPLDGEAVKAYQEARRRREQDLLIERDGGRYLRSVQWNSVPLKDYHMAIPEFALNRALELKRELPEAQFFVEGMQYVRNDPFMVMCVGLQCYYIDVWEEPEFEGRRTV